MTYKNLVINPVAFGYDAPCLKDVFTLNDKPVSRHDLYNLYIMKMSAYKIFVPRIYFYLALEEIFPTFKVRIVTETSMIIESFKLKLK